MIAGGLETK